MVRVLFKTKTVSLSLLNATSQNADLKNENFNFMKTILFATKHHSVFSPHNITYYPMLY